MNLLEKFNELNNLAKFGWTIEINEHRQSYETIEQWIESTSLSADNEIRMMMIERGQMIVIYAYPRNTATFLHVIHYDLVVAIDEMIKCVKDYIAESPGSL